MDLKSMTVGQIGVMREVTYDLRSALEKMQKITPDLRLDMSQFPRIVIDVPWDEEPAVEALPVEATANAIRTSLEKFKASVSPYVADLDPGPEQGPDFQDIETPTARLSGLGDCPNVKQALPAIPSADRVILDGKGDEPADAPSETAVKAEADIYIPAEAPPPANAGPDRGNTPPPVAPVARTKTGRALAPNWTAYDDDLAMKLLAEGLGVDDIAMKLGRPVEGTRFRFKNALRDRVLEVRRAMVKELSKGVDLQAVEPPKKPDTKRPMTDDLHNLTAVQRAISYRFDALGYRDGHTSKNDLDLVHRLMRGEKLSMIAADWGSDTRALKKRFADLCGIEAPSPDLHANVLAALKARAAWVG